jgi:hypothetical protein
MSVFPIVHPRFRAFDANGDPLAGGLLYAYAAGTTTPLDTFTTRAGTVANTNPVVLDANGEADVWLTPSVDYKFVLKDSAGVTQWTEDNVPSTQTYALLPDGSVTAPALAFASDITTGIFRPAPSQVGVATGGVLAALFTTTQARMKDGAVGAPGVTFQSEPSTGFFRIGPGQVGLSILGVLVGTWDANGLLALLRNTAGNGQTGLDVTTTGTGKGAVLSAASGSGQALQVIGNATKAPLNVGASGNPPSSAVAGDVYKAGTVLKISTGSAWVPVGTGTASVQTTPAGNIGAGEDDLLSDSIDANTLEAGGLVRISASGTTANNANAKTLDFYLGSTARLVCLLTTSIAADWFATVLIYRVGINSQRYVCRVDEVNQATGAVRSFFAQGTAAETETAAIAVKFTGTATANNDITQNAMALELP